MIVSSLFCAQIAAKQFVDDFALLDQYGKHHQLYYHQDKHAIVLMVHGNGCPIVRNLTPDLNKLHAKFAKQEVVFLMLNANLQDDRVSIRKETEQWKLRVPVLVDESQMVGKSLGVTRTAEVFVIDPKSWQIVYRGPLNDRVTYEFQKDKAESEPVNEILLALTKGRPIPVFKDQKTVGCAVNIVTSDESLISYSEDIAPILERRCVYCHKKEGIAPWSMNSYRAVLGFSRMMREVILSGRMPPEGADPRIGSFKNTNHLTPDEKAKLINWIDAGAKFDGADPLATAKAYSEEREQPGLVIELPSFTVPASGIVEYQFPVVMNPLTEDTWIEAVEFVPGVKEAVHHAIIGVSDRSVQDSIEGAFDNVIGSYGPGVEVSRMPDDGGVLLRRDSKFLFQIHYTAIGRKIEDRSILNVYFHRETPVFPVRHQVLVDPNIEIPPGDDSYTRRVSLMLERDVVLFSLLPHAHYRGKSARFLLIDAETGREKPLLSVPDYDFNWQRDYVLKKPLHVTAGSRIVYEAVYDNSSANTVNPDPDQLVRWGLQSTDEMLYGGITFRWAEETVERQIHDQSSLRYAVQFGYLDQNMDGELTMDELKSRPFLHRISLINRGDRNNDNKLTFKEYVGSHYAEGRAKF